MQRRATLLFLTVRKSRLNWLVQPVAGRSGVTPWLANRERCLPRGAVV